MAGNMRFDLASASNESSFAGNYQNGQRAYSGPTLDRSSSFRESAESRSLGTGKANSKMSAALSGDVPTLSQCLMLDPIIMGDQRHARPSDVRRVLGISVGNGSEDNSYGASHSKNSPPGTVEELKRLRANVADTCVKASGRAKKFDEHLNKLNKLFGDISTKKQPRNELLINERSSGSTLKIGSQIQRNPPESGSHKFDDRPKNVGINKRSRTPVADNRAESRSNGVIRQPLLMTKERDLVKDYNTVSDMAEEKIRRLPVGGEGWDKKMKRKRSVGAVFPRSIENDRELKRAMHHKLPSESGMQSSDSIHGFRLGASGGTNKLDPSSSPTGSNIRTTLKSEQEKSMLSRDLSAVPIKERALGKVNVKLSNREDNNPMCRSPIVKGKASRTARGGSMVAANSAANTQRVSGTLESWEQSPVVNKNPSVGGANNRKRAIPAGSSSPPITQWVGQRPQKISRTRRTNLLPVSNHDELQMQSEGCSPSDLDPRLSAGGMSASLLSKNAGIGNQNIKVKLDNVPSPVRLSETEESGAGDDSVKEKSVDGGDVVQNATNTGQNVGSSAAHVKKNKIKGKEEIGDGVRRQGRSGRTSPFSRASVSPTRDRLDNAAPTKPLRNARSVSDKSGSKFGRPLKKLSDRKGFSRLSHMASGDSPDCSGESEDDHEELLAAANLACSSSRDGCSSAFWKISEEWFASVGPDKKSFLLGQLKLAEELCGISSHNCSHGNYIQDDHGCEDIAAFDDVSCRRNKHVKNEIESKDFLDQFIQRQSPSLLGCSDAEKTCDIPIYQRVLSALIVEDEVEEFEENGFDRISSFNDSCHRIGSERKHIDRLDFCDPMFGVQSQKNGSAHIIFSCNGNANFDKSPSAHDRLCNVEPLQRDGGYLQSEVEVLVRLSRCDYVPHSRQTASCGISSFDCQYELISPEKKLIVELQSLDLFLEAVPALDDKEDLDNQENQLMRRLHVQRGVMRTRLVKIQRAIEEQTNIKRREGVAMDKLTELAYKKVLATRGSFASKYGIAKVSKQAASALTHRTVARCRKFDDSGTSCFSEPALRNIVYATPPRFDETELLIGTNSAVAKNRSSSDAFGNPIHQSDHAFAKSGPISNRGKKKEVLLDDVGGGSVFRSSSAIGIPGGTKGKRSERDRDAKVGRSAMGGSKGERKTKSKPKQKTGQLSTSRNGLVNKFSETPSASGSGDSANSNGTRKRDVRFMSSGNVPPVSPNVMKESTDLVDLPLTDIDGLGVDTETGAPRDLNSWLDFEMDGLQDHDSIGLEIPMDDLTDLHMF